MKASEADILIVPGWSSSGPDHWQSRWERNLTTARRIEQLDWINAERDAWVARLIEEIAASVRPVVLVAHSLGVITVVHAAAKIARIPAHPVKGAFLVAPADVDNAHIWPVTEGETFNGSEAGFAPVPIEPLPFPSALLASSNDPYCSLERARGFAKAWGSVLVESGALGHINTASGHGPWPEGLLAFGVFMKRLGVDVVQTRH